MTLEYSGFAASWLSSWVFIGIAICYAPFILQGFVLWMITHWTGKRIHYIELHEEKWFPKYLRHWGNIQMQSGWTLYSLNTIFGGLSPAQTLGHIISKILFTHNDGVINDNNSSNKNTLTKLEPMTMLLDTCSGASGPTHIVHSYLTEKHEKREKNNNNSNNSNNKNATTRLPFVTLLSDLWPHTNAWEALCQKYKNLSFVPTPLDACNVEINKSMITFFDSDQSKSARKLFEYCIESRIKRKDRWLRSIFGSFHHLRPKQVENVFYDVIKSGDGLLIAEKILDRSFIGLIKWPLLVTISHPVKWIHSVYYLCTHNNYHGNIFGFLCELVFITLIQPIIMMVWMHDTCTSSARTYTVDECKEIFNVALHKCALKEKGYKQGSDDYNKFVQSYQFQATIQSTLMPKPWSNFVKLTIMTILPVKQG